MGTFDFTLKATCEPSSRFHVRVCWRHLLSRTHLRLGSTQTAPLAVFKLPVNTGNSRLLDGPVWVCNCVCMCLCVVLHDSVDAGVPGREHAVGGTGHLGADVLGRDAHAAWHLSSRVPLFRERKMRCFQHLAASECTACCYRFTTRLLSLFSETQLDFR